MPLVDTTTAEVKHSTMKFIQLVLTGFCYFITLNARLIEKSTDRTLTTETKTTGSSPPVRLTRQVFEEDAITGISKEDAMQSDEFVRSYNRRARHFFKGQSSSHNASLSPAVRIPRESNEKVETIPKNATPTSSAPAKQKITLVKKPIPKYNEMDYEDDFQMKISRSPVRVIDSGEHEDEDFNLDDYDFDVNHDEFIGRGKPLEPRTKHKDINERSNSNNNQNNNNHNNNNQNNNNQNNNNQNNRPQIPVIPKHDQKPAAGIAPEVKIQSKVNIPVTNTKVVSSKKERAIQTPKKTVERDDYYDDSSSTTKSPEKGTKTRELDDEFNDDNEESKEFDGKTVRIVRSPWKLNSYYADKLGEKTSSVMVKVLSILPMFPQVPHKTGEDEYLNEVPTDPWTDKIE